ncbi:MAG: CDP-diacylglycerol--serine O-phosphatidyltransferase [Candidatus Omnitrophica bacterium]|nr:CDP-diacylglycerol--serine O-phosphatidyltransferase [Candidatus Omnitrophota bacterium]
MKRHLANFFTILSLFAGFLSIVLSLEEHFTFACWFIFISVILDGLDGQIARINLTANDLGKELDSLVDVVSFGLAPSILGYTFIYREFYLGAVLGLFFYLLCSTWRLARYNVTPMDKDKIFYFYGLPTTASGASLASFVLIYRKKESLGYLPYLFLFLVIILGILMISKIHYLNLDGIKRLFGRRFSVFCLILIALLILSLFLGFSGMTLFLVCLVYIFSPLLIKNLKI